MKQYIHKYPRRDGEYFLPNNPLPKKKNKYCATCYNGSVMNKKPARKVGRPTSYDPSMVDQIDQYLLTVGREQTKLPKRVDIALLLGVNEDTLVEWEKLNKEFSAAIRRVDQLQKAQLMDDGMYGGKEVNPKIAQFLLNVNHKMVEANKTDITSQGEKIEPTTIVIVEDKQNE